jgi:hypothetical protein
MTYGSPIFDYDPVEMDHTEFMILSLLVTFHHVDVVEFG